MDFLTKIRMMEHTLHIAGITRQYLDLPIPPTAIRILKDLDARGYQGLVVGGAVRDALAGTQSKDIDIEIYGIGIEDLLGFLEHYGRAHLEGKSFGVIKLKDDDGYDYDFSIPRRDSKIENDPTSRTDTSGRGIQVELDKNMSPEEAASRRDFTINALAYDPLTEELHDYFGGKEDFSNKILRATSPAFTEDPLRVLRGMQFAARFDMQVDPHTAGLCKSMKNEILQKDRVRDEWMKFFSKAVKPSKGLQFLLDTDWVDNYPELKSIVGLQQDSTWHPEGTVDVHTGLTMDAAAKIAERKDLAGDNKTILIASALCHDLGKSTTTGLTDEGKITSHGHPKESRRLTELFMDSIGMSKDITNVVVPLVGEHMVHVDYNPNSKKSTVMHLAEKLNKATIEQLEDVIQADMDGRGYVDADMPDRIKQIVDMAKEKGVYQGKAVDLLTGADLLAISPAIYGSKELGSVLKQIRGEQLKGNITTKEEAIQYADKPLQKYFGLLDGNDVVNALGGDQGPLVGQILQDAWQAQLSGEFNTQEEALSWVSAYAGQYTQQDIDDENNNIAKTKSIDELIRHSKSGKGRQSAMNLKDIKNINELLKYAAVKYKIYCDMDGVLTDFVKSFEKFGKGTIDEFRKDHTESEFWDVINTDPHFFLHMEWLPGGNELWSAISHFNPTILTTPANMEYCKEDKKKWLKQNTGDVDVLFSSNKYEYADENSILIDDMEKNIKPWREAGGIGILHTDVNNTLLELQRLLT